MSKLMLVNTDHKAIVLAWDWNGRAAKPHWNVGKKKK